MASEFWVYLRLGVEHIADVNGYDHILFIAALCAVYQLNHWKELLWLVTAFTVGHSITLVLATLNIIPINSAVVEFLIPLTIFITSVINIMDRKPETDRRSRNLKYGLALGFGLIHGMGFSNFLRTILGFEESIVWPLFAFNVGLEIGQILIVIAVLAVSWLMLHPVHMKHREWNLVLSGAAAGIAIILMFERL